MEKKNKANKRAEYKKAKLECGKGALDVEADVSAEELNQKIEKFIETEINVTDT